ncbi:MAG: DUF1801 domain-containing protein [Bacteroidetes bacterium]|nr:DUF1801 domain-containing protein [Bacteroidota bacterium]
MISNAATPEEYINSLPVERKQVVIKLRETVLKNLPEGFAEEINYGILGYVVPHSIYPEGYHCNPKLPLPFMNIASQKNFIAVYHMGIYSDKKLLEWFTADYKKISKTKLDMGKSCIRFKKIDQIPFELIGELCTKISPQQWIAVYEKHIKRKK